MGDAGFVRFPANLDPGAQEFRPINQYGLTHVPVVSTQIYYPYPCPSYSSPVPELPFISSCDGTLSWGYTTTPLYGRTADVEPVPVPVPSPLPCPTSMPSRSLLLSLLPTDVSESTVRRELEVFGDVRAVQMERIWEGLATVHFYDLRHAQTALLEIQGQHMQQQWRLRRHFEAFSPAHYPSSLLPQPPPPLPAPGLVGGHVVWAQFLLPMMLNVPDGQNQGTIVIFNLDSEVSTSNLKEIFEAFGTNFFTILQTSSVVILSACFVSSIIKWISAR